MKRNIIIQPSIELAYWVGAVQSDGSLKIYNERDRKNPRYRISLGVSKKSLPMLIKFQRICKNVFNRNIKIFKSKTREIWNLNIRIKGLLELFHKLDIKFNKSFSPPKWCTEGPEFFGAYLAGIIDGDGNVTVKRKKYPQCLVRIFSGYREKKLANEIRRILGCCVSIYKKHKKRYFTKENRVIDGTWFELHFLISSKNYKFIENFVLPNIMLPYKKERINNFIQNRGRSIASVKAYNGLVCGLWEPVTRESFKLREFKSRRPHLKKS